MTIYRYKTYHCIQCGKLNENRPNTSGKYCNNQCQQDHQYKKRVDEWKAGGKLPGRSGIKRYLSEKKEGCWQCGITKWNGKDIVLELEHIDGNSENNTEENLSLLCPNCHSQTCTYKGKNAGNGRHSRRVRYANGKSY